MVSRPKGRAIEEVFEAVGEKEMFDHLDNGIDILDSFVRAGEIDSKQAIRRGFMVGLMVAAQMDFAKVPKFLEKVREYVEAMNNEPGAEEEILEGQAVASVLEFLEKTGEKAGITEKAELVKFAKEKFRAKMAKEKETKH